MPPTSTFYQDALRGMNPSLDVWVHMLLWQCVIVPAGEALIDSPVLDSTQFSIDRKLRL